ncbi:Retrovirus-related Pol polyprotein [Thelohanellus kitauei]|uniref:Retrovirus-related Pol polyprotein n=1 Tax=Thelohanellus kitauei TaxID=669202 RepID=A0A0C2IV43_THEKT|nr:Retrovirus-related Pol polyprotein [Thelohanellus kitauei]
MSKDVAKWIQDCDSCNRNKHRNYTPKAKLTPIVSRSLFSMWCIDFVGPLPTTKNGNRYILVMTDHFSRWVEAVALPDQTAESTSKAVLSNIVCRYGVPEGIHSDKGTQFESAVFSKLCNYLKINKTRTTSYHPMGNGMVERTNRTLKEMLRSYVSEFQHTWDVYLDLCLMSLRTTENASTKFSPSAVVFGRELKTTVEINKDTQNALIDLPSDKYIKNIFENQRKIHQIIKRNSDKSRLSQKHYYDSSSQANEFTIGEKVYIKNRHGPKLGPLFNGPFMIAENLYPDYIIFSPSNSTVKLRVHHNLLFKQMGAKFEPRTCEDGPSVRRSERTREPVKPFQISWQPSSRRGNNVA